MLWEVRNLASTEGVNIVISGDSSQAVKAVDDVSKAIDGVKSTSVKVTADASQAIGEVNKVADTVGSINDTHTEITADSSQAIDAAGKASNAMENISNAHAEITADGSQAVDEAGKVADAENAIKDAHSNITADGSQAINELERLEKLIFGIDRKKVEFQVKGVIRDEKGRLRDLSGKFLKMGQNAGEAFAAGTDSGIKRVEQSLNKILAFNVGDKISSFFGSIFDGIISSGKKVASALSEVMKSALAIGGGFEAQMTSVQVISGAVGKDLQDLTDKAREMGATLPISARDAATAMTLLAQRGMQAKDILATVSEVANLSISQGVDMGSAADILGSTMTNFGLSVDYASKITAIFNNACNQSALSMSKLIEAMKYVGPAAGSVDMQLTEAVSAMEAIANAGLTGEMTGTGLAMVLSKLAATTKIMGVNTKELDGSLRPLKDIFTELKNAGFSLSDAITAFGQRGSKAALALAKNSDKLAENEERLKNWGSTQAAVDAKAKTFTNTMAAFKSAVEELHIEIFEQIKDQSKEAVGSVAELTRAFSKWVGETQIAGKSLNAFLEGLGFNIPSGADFQQLLKQFDVQAFVDKVQNFASTLKGIGQSITGMFNKIKTPLSWLINHLDTFATISFWGWILGKGLQIPAAIMGVVTSFNALYASVKTLLSLSWTNLIPLLSTPAGLAGAGILASVGVGVGVAAYTATKMNSANEQLRKAIDEEKRYLSEQAKADVTLPVDIQFEFKTGFEKLPESWAKASDKVRAEANITVKELQEQFRGKVAEAITFLTSKFPEMSDAFKLAANSINDSILRQVSAALHGSQKDFEALPEVWQKVAERIKAVDIGYDKIGIHLLSINNNFKQLKQEIEKPIQKTETQVFFEELSSAVKGVTESIAGEIQRANSFLDEPNGQLAVKVSLAQAQKKLDDFVKNAAKKYSLPEDIVKASLIQNLEKLALTGNNTAQSLFNSFGEAGGSLNTLLENAKDAISYLEVSPTKFLPALKSIMNGIQKFDPLTGKVTEKFKKAYDTLKQWSNVSFSELSESMSELRRAFEGGFISKSKVKDELQNSLPDIKLQIVDEAKHLKEQYKSEEVYNSVIASKFSRKVEDLFGDIGLEFLKNTYGNRSGDSIGKSILNDVEEILAEQKRNNSNISADNNSSNNNLQQTLGNFATRLEQISSSQAIPSSANTATREENRAAEQNSQIVTEIKNLLPAIQNISTSVNNGVHSMISTIVSVALPNKKSDTASSEYDFSSEIASVVKEIQSLADNINALNKSTSENTSAISQLHDTWSIHNGTNSQTYSSDFATITSAVLNISATLNIIQDTQMNHSSAFSEVITAVHSVENSLRSFSAGNNYDIDIHQQGFVIDKKSDADALARNTVSALRSGLGNGGL